MRSGGKMSKLGVFFTLVVLVSRLLGCAPTPEKPWSMPITTPLPTPSEEWGPIAVIQEISGGCSVLKACVEGPKATEKHCQDVSLNDDGTKTFWVPGGAVLWLYSDRISWHLPPAEVDRQVVLRCDHCCP